MNLTKPIFLLICCVFFLGCKTESNQEKTIAINPTKEIVLSGLKHPWSISFISENEALITEKDGDLRKANLTTKETIAIKGFPEDLVDSIRVKDFRDNSGIFEVLLHPQFDENKWIYISYVSEKDNLTTTKVIRAKLEQNTLSEIITIFVAEPYSADLFHYGGGMCFGQDGKLYFTIGERLFHEREEPPLPIAQDVKDKRGKIYRLNDDGSVPEDNPDWGEEAIPGIYAIGIRAAQGITCDSETGEIWFSEHGSKQGDELNLLQANANYGWPIKTSGQYRNQDYSPPSLDIPFTEPKHYWLQTIAPTGLCFYNGTDFPQWKGDIILSGLSRGSLWRIHLDENREVDRLEELFVNDRMRSRKVACSPEGTLYMLTDEMDGKLIRIVNK